MDLPTLTIQFNPVSREVKVQGPIGDKGLCYLMLECARDAVKDFSDAQRKGEPSIIPVSRINLIQGPENGG